MAFGGALAFVGGVAAGADGVAVLVEAHATNISVPSAVAVKNRNCALKSSPPVSAGKEH
jgi:hypothetical protein